MRSLLITILCCLFFCTNHCAAQADITDTLDVVNWNLRYFADGSQSNPTYQVSKTRIIMNNINADVYAICEVVNVDSFAHLAQSLNGDYGWYVSQYGSLASSPSSQEYASAQKLGFIYRKSMFRNISTRGLLKSSSNAYTNFASGRFPFLVSGEVLGKDSNWHSINFMVMHAKAQDDYDACTRRIYACKELKDTLDQYFVNKPFLLLGDYNDDLDTTICTSYTTSNYSLLVADSNDYKALTLPLSRAGAISIDGYTSLIDHVVASNGMYRYYLPNSAQSLRSQVKSWVTYYKSDVSDHFPILTRYVIDDRATGVATVSASSFAIFPNPATSEFSVNNPSGQYQQYVLQSIDGRFMAQGNLVAGDNKIPVMQLPQGIYLIRLSGRDVFPAVSKIMVSH